MKRRSSPPRPDWQKKCEAVGFMHHTTVDESTGQSTPYWDESVCYEFTVKQIDELEEATEQLQKMCMAVVQKVIDENRFGLFRIPESFQQWIIQSWNRDDRQIYGRFDLAYDGVNPPKLLEYNADTPTSLVEAAVVQWYWLKDINENADQFNSIHERLIQAWKDALQPNLGPLYFASMHNNLEDHVTADYLMDTALQAGNKVIPISMNEIGLNTQVGFVDKANRRIGQMFKLYPWEWMITENFGKALPRAKVRWFEPPWKAILSCKSILPLLYEMFPDSEYLLPASFTPLEQDHVVKPIHAREGANIRIVRDGHVRLKTDGPYDENFSVYQEIASIPSQQGKTPVIGSWVINGEASGIGIREDDTMITSNRSRFIPHYFIE